jgi:hypothetical protein
MNRAGSPTSSPEADQIRTALQQHLRLPDENFTTLREAVCAFVAALRSAGLPPERTLVLVKAVMGSVHPAPHHIDRQRELTGRIAGWCVEEYYGTSAAD